MGWDGAPPKCCRRAGQMEVLRATLPAAHACPAAGVFGCHAALVLRRLRRLCDRAYHSQVADRATGLQAVHGAGDAWLPPDMARAHHPQRFCLPPRPLQPVFAVTTATVANPREHALELLGVQHVEGEAGMGGSAAAAR